MSLDLAQIRELAAIVQRELRCKGAEFVAWRNPPTIDDGRITHTSGYGEQAQAEELTVAEAFDVYQRKLDGVYAERLALAVCTAIAAVKAGQDVALLQIQKEPNAQFDAEGWLVLAIEGHPMFHISPTDLPVAVANDAGLVTLVEDGTAEAERYSWKNTTKLDELCLLLDLLR